MRESLSKAHIGNIDIKVVDGDIVKRDKWWHVTVVPTAQPPSMHQYYEVLANVENELQEEHDLKVWLVPTVPD